MARSVRSGQPDSAAVSTSTDLPQQRQTDCIVQSWCRRHQAAARARASLHASDHESPASKSPHLGLATISSRVLQRAVQLPRYGTAVWRAGRAGQMLHIVPIACLALALLASGEDRAGPRLIGDHVVPDRRTAERAAEFHPIAALSFSPLAAPPLVLESRQPATVAPPLDQRPVWVATHIVVPGERLEDIAQQFGLPATTVAWANNVDAVRLLGIGEELRLPRLAGVPHIVVAGDTIESLASRYGVSPESILYFGPNGLAGTGVLSPGRELFVPSGEQAIAGLATDSSANETTLAGLVAVDVAVVREHDANLREGPSTRHRRMLGLAAGRRVQVVARHKDWLQVLVPGEGSGWIHTALLDVDDTTITRVPESDAFPPPPPIWVWPAQGSITSGFGSRWGGFHNGLDIANSAWTPIVAARAGRVVEAGWCSGYGYCVKLAHDGGLLTEYGHLVDQPVVAVGDDVNAGDAIGYMGSTFDRAGGGFSSGVHLHFTVKLNSQAINPLTVLP